MKSINKIDSIKNLSKKILFARKKGLKIGLSHGLFDLLHPGHIFHLNEAKKHCDILIVSTTSDEFLRKNLDGPYYKELQRKIFLSSLDVVDFVCSVPDTSAIKVLNDLKPNFYFKGIEYLNEDHVGNFIKEKNLCKKNNIKIKFVGKKIFSSSKILFDKYYNRSDKEFEKYIIDTKKKEINFEKIIKKISNLKILLFGEIIFDKYTYVKINGVSSKASALSSSIISSKNMAGGILLSSNFLHQFSKKIDVLSLMNQDLKKNNQLFKLIKNKKNLIFSKSFPTILKERFIQTEKNTLSKKKLLTLNHFENKIITNQDENKILSFLKKNLKKYDIVIVQDFGHGLINKKIANYISEKSNFLSINVQSNSTNFGFNIINQKFKKADLFVIDENEIQLYSKRKNLNFSETLKNLKKDLNSSFAFLTRGEIYSLLIQEKNKVLKLKSLKDEIVDSVGAGDIFHSFASVLSTSIKDNNHLILLLAQIAGSIAVTIEGNERTPTLNEIKNTLNFYLNK